MIEILNICLHQNSIVIKFLKILKIREIYCEIPRIIFVLFYDVHKENMFTSNLEDGLEAPSKARKKGAKRLEFLLIIRLTTSEKYNNVSFIENRKSENKSKKCGQIISIKQGQIQILSLFLILQINWCL